MFDISREDDSIEKVGLKNLIGLELRGIYERPSLEEGLLKALFWCVCPFDP